MTPAREAHYAALKEMPGMVLDGGLIWAAGRTILEFIKAAC